MKAKKILLMDRHEICNPKIVTTEMFNEAIAELEALQSRSCEGCKYGKFGADSRGIEVECTLIWHCARGNGFPDRYEPKPLS